MQIIVVPQPIDTTITLKEFKLRFTGAELRAFDKSRARNYLSPVYTRIK